MRLSEILTKKENCISEIKKIIFRAAQEWIPRSETIERRLILYVTNREITYVREYDPLSSAPRLSGRGNFRAWVKSSGAVEINLIDQHKGTWYEEKPEWIRKRVYLFKR